jgi:hypothetical protein
MAHPHFGTLVAQSNETCSFYPREFNLFGMDRNKFDRKICFDYQNHKRCQAAVNPVLSLERKGDGMGIVRESSSLGFVIPQSKDARCFYEAP